MPNVPAKLTKEFHHFSQKSKRKQEEQSCIKMRKVPKLKHKKVGF